MNLSEDDIDILRGSFLQICEKRVEIEESMHANLFSIAPDTRPLFGDKSLIELGEQFFNGLCLIMSQIHDLDGCRDMINDLAKRHAAYGVQPKDFESLGKAMLMTFDEVLEGGMTPEVTRAWTIAYASISGAMIAAAWDGVETQAI